MPQPYNYMLNLPSPTEKVLGAVSIAQNLKKMQTQEQALQQRQQVNKVTQDLYNKIKAGTATGADFQSMALITPKDQSEASLKIWESMSKERQQNTLNFGSQVMAALGSKNPQIGIDLLNERAEAARNSGDEDQAKAYETWAKISELDPTAAQTVIGGMLQGLPGGKDAIESFVKLQEDRRKTALEPGELKKQGLELGLTEAQVNKTIIDTKKGIADIALTNANADKVASEAALNRMKLQQERAQGIKLGAPAEKLLNDSVMESVNSKNLAKQYGELADSIQAEITASGLTGKATELVKKWSGNENNVTRLRQDYKRLRNSAALAMLPPGAASDKDIEVAMSGFPEDTSDPQLISTFMRGMQKLKNYDAEMNSIKADWINTVGNLGSLKVDTTIGGKTVPAGTSFDDYVKENLVLPNIAETENTVVINGQQFTRPANFTDEQWTAYKQSQGVK